MNINSNVDIIYSGESSQIAAFDQFIFLNTIMVSLSHDTLKIGI